MKKLKYRKIGSSIKHKWAMLRNMVTSLIVHERIQTTVPKAKEVRLLADRIIRFGKEGMKHVFGNNIWLFPSHRWFVF